MPRIEEKVRSLLDERDEIEDELYILLDEIGDEPVTWEDIDGTGVTTGTWGRVIQKGILEDVDGGLTFADREVVEAVLEDDGEFEFETTGWKRRDKIAGLGGIVLLMSYSIPVLRNGIGEVLNLLLGPLANVVPFYGVIIILGIATGLISSVIRGKMVNEVLVNDVKEKLNELKEIQKKESNPDDIESLDDLPEEQRQMFSLQKVMMTEQFRPMAWIILMTIPVFLWLYWKASHPSLSEADRLLIMPFMGEVDLGSPLIGPLQTWILWYVVVSASSTQVIRKYLNIGL